MRTQIYAHPDLCTPRFMSTQVYALEEHANGGTDEFGTTRPDIGSPERRPTAARSKKEINEAKQLLLELGLTDCPT